MARRRRRRRSRSLRVLKALSSPLRLEILDLLLNRGPLSYTEIMNSLRLSPTRDAGRFAYHLKFLLKAGIIDPDAKTKKYHITDLGGMIISVSEEIEEHVSKRRKLLVRTSRFAIEEFDRTKIVDSLVEEASVPVDLAQKIARETENRLLESKIKYLTAPLIREFVNAVLLENGLEEYRHKLTRLGLPVYDVTQLMKSIGYLSLGVEAVHKAASDAVMEEYILLNVLPRDVADAHLSGTLHISDLGYWVLKPNELTHDLRFFLQWGLKFGRVDFTGMSYPPPKSFKSALLMTCNVLKISVREAFGEQALDFFNVFLAPFAKGLPKEEIKDNLRFFIHNLNQSISNTGACSPIEASLGLELTIPDFLEEKEAVGPSGKTAGSYMEFIEESRLIAKLLLEVVSEDGVKKPVFNPSLIIKLRPGALKSGECEDLLFLSHNLAAMNGTPYFGYLGPQKRSHVTHTATGGRFATDWTGDWELDTLRTGDIGSVVINLPRISYDAKGKQKTFFDLLDERLEMAVRALEIKYQTIKQRAREGLLPFLTQKIEGNRYLRLENASRLVSFVGLNEAVKSLSGQFLHENAEALDLADRIVGHFFHSIQRYARKPETRLSSSMISNPTAAKRVAELDVESYGWSKVNAQGTKEQPFYTDLFAVPLEYKISWNERLNIEERFHKLTPGSHLAIIQLDDLMHDPNELLTATSHILKTHKIELYTYNKNLAHCDNCQKTFHGIMSKCPLCGSVDALVCFSRMSAKYSPISHWSPAKRLVLSDRSPFMSISK